MLQIVVSNESIRKPYKSCLYPPTLLKSKVHVRTRKQQMCHHITHIVHGCLGSFKWSSKTVRIPTLFLKRLPYQEMNHIYFLPMAV